MTRVHVGLGSNVGERQYHIDKAISEVGKLHGTQVLEVSSMRETEPMGGPPQQRRFINAAMVIETEMEPLELMLEFQSIERELGRRRNVRWGPRTIDLDILTFGDRVIDTPELVVPHPELPRRRFVLEPLAEIDPEFVHPVTGRSFKAMLAELDRAAS